MIQKHGVSLVRLSLIIIGLSCLIFTPLMAQDDMPQIIGDEVEKIAWSPDGSQIAIAGGSSGCDPERRDDYAVRILDVATSQIISRFRGHSCRLVAVDWSPDGSRIVSSGFTNSETFIWDAITGDLLVTGRFQVETGVGVVWSPDSTQIASIGSGGRNAFVWDAETGEILYNLPEHDDFTTSVAWHPDGSSIATSSLDNTVQIWDTETQQNIMTLQHSTSVRWVAWSPDGSKLATARDDGTVQIWNAVTGESLFTLQGHIASAERVSWSSDGSRLASDSLDGTIRIWDTTGGALIEIIESDAGQIVDLMWSPVGDEVAYIGRNTGSQGGFPQIIIASSETSTFTDELGPLFTTALAVSPDGTRIALGRSPRRCIPVEASLELKSQASIRILDVQTGQEIAQIVGPVCRINDLEWNSDGTQLALSQNVFATAWTYNFDTQRFNSPRGSSSGGEGGPESGGVAWTSDDEYLVNISHDIATVSVLNSTSFDLVTTFRDPDEERVTAVDIGINNFLAIADFAPSVQIWDIEDIATPQLVIEHDFGTNALAWSPDGTLLALGSGEIFLIDPFEGSIQQTLRGHTDAVVEIKWSPDGNLLATGSLDNTIRIWDALSGSELAHYPINTRLPAFDWSPDSTQLIYAIENADQLVVLADAPMITPTQTATPAD